MRRGTTPTITVHVDADITDLNVYLAFRVGSKLLVKSGNDLTVTAGENNSTDISVTLTQEDTLGFNAGGDCEVQIRAEKLDGAVAIATTIGTIPVRRILQNGYIGARN